MENPAISFLARAGHGFFRAECNTGGNPVPCVGSGFSKIPVDLPDVADWYDDWLDSSLGVSIHEKPTLKSRTSLLPGVASFFDLRTTNRRSGTGFDQNRALVGTGWPLSGKLSFATGNLNQFLWVDNGEDVSNHLAVFNFRTKF